MRPLVFSAILVSASCGVSPTVKPMLEARRPVSSDGPKKIAAFCVSKTGAKVGNGECWTLADEAFRSAGVQRPGSGLRVWGRKVDYRKESLKAGDVIEFESASFADGTITGSAHTAVVVRGGSASHVGIAEQNWGKKTVRIRDLDLTGLRRGRVSVYRPE